MRLAPAYWPDGRPSAVPELWPPRVQSPTSRQCGAQAPDRPQNLGPVLRDFQPGGKPFNQTRRGPRHKLSALTKLGPHVGLQQVEMTHVIGPQDVSTAARLQPHRSLEVRIDRSAHDSRVDLPILEEAAPRAPQPPMEIQAPVARSLLICWELGVGRDSGAPVTPRTVHQNLIEEVISVLAFASISNRSPDASTFPLTWTACQNPTRCPAGTHLARRRYRRTVAPAAGALD